MINPKIKLKAVSCTQTGKPRAHNGNQAQIEISATTCSGWPIFIPPLGVALPNKMPWELIFEMMASSAEAPPIPFPEWMGKLVESFQGNFTAKGPNGIETTIDISEGSLRPKGIHMEKVLMSLWAPGTKALNTFALEKVQLTEPYSRITGKFELTGPREAIGASPDSGKTGALWCGQCPPPKISDASLIDADLVATLKPGLYKVPLSRPGNDAADTHGIWIRVADGTSVTMTVGAKGGLRRVFNPPLEVPRAVSTADTFLDLGGSSRFAPARLFTTAFQRLADVSVPGLFNPTVTLHGLDLDRSVTPAKLKVMASWNGIRVPSLKFPLPTELMEESLLNISDDNPSNLEFFMGGILNHISGHVSVKRPDGLVTTFQIPKPLKVTPEGFSGQEIEVITSGNNILNHYKIDECDLTQKLYKIHGCFWSTWGELPPTNAVMSVR